MRFGGRKEKLKTIATDRTQSVSCVHPLESTKPMSWLEVQDWDKNLDGLCEAGATGCATVTNRSGGLRCILEGSGSQATSRYREGCRDVAGVTWWAGYGRACSINAIRQSAAHWRQRTIDGQRRNEQV